MYSHRYHSPLVWLILGGSTEVALSPRPPGRRRCQRPASANPWRDPCGPCCLTSDPTSSPSESLDESIGCQCWIACMFLLAGYKIFLWQKMKELNYPSKVDLVLATIHVFFNHQVCCENSILIGKYSISLNVDQERFGGVLTWFPSIRSSFQHAANLGYHASRFVCFNPREKKKVLQ